MTNISSKKKKKVKGRLFIQGKIAKNLSEHKKINIMNDLKHLKGGAKSRYQRNGLTWHLNFSNTVS